MVGQRKQKELQQRTAGFMKRSILKTDARPARGNMPYARVTKTQVIMAAANSNTRLHHNKIKDDLVLLREENALLFVHASHQKTD